MSREQCPDCNSSTGYAPYPDGMFCHSCKKYTPGKTEVRESKQLTIPNSNNYKLPPQVIEYLKDYGITNPIKFNIWWSEEYQRLCFPYYNAWSEEPAGCWMRGFDKDKPKWLFAGKKNFSWWLGGPALPGCYNCLGEGCINCPAGPPVCLVEDVISAIRTSQYMDTICLGGTRLSEYDKEVIKNYKNAILFLDGDEAGRTAARKIRLELKLTHEVRIIRAHRDPKCHTDEELWGILECPSNYLY